MLLNSKVVKTEKVTPEKFLSLSNKDKANVESAKIVPPILGKSGFGSIELKYKNPIYKVSI